MTWLFRLTVFLGVLSIPVIFSCAGDTDPIKDSIVSSIELRPNKSGRLDAATSETMNISLLVKDQFNEIIELDTDRELIWSVNSNHVSVDNSGKVTALSPGNPHISVKLKEIEAEIEVLVWDSSEPRVEVFISDAGAN